MISNDKFSLLFNNMTEGVAFHHYVEDDKGEIINYIIDDVNPAFEKMLKIKKSAAIGKLATDVYGVSEAPALSEYKSLQTAKSLKFEIFFNPLKKYFSISACSWNDDSFATIFFDVTDDKKIEQDLKEKNENLEKMNNLMVDRELKMIELKSEIYRLKNIRTKKVR